MISRNNNVKVNSVYIFNYAKYILKEGKNIEKRELLECLKSKIILENKTICLIH